MPTRIIRRKNALLKVGNKSDRIHARKLPELQRAGMSTLMTRDLFRQCWPEVTDADGPARRSDFFGLLTSVLNSLDRPEEATEMFRCAVTEARRVDPAGVQFDVATCCSHGFAG